MMTIEMMREAGDWPDSVDDIAQIVEKIIFNHFDLSLEEFETTILLTDDAHMQELNREFRAKDKPTDVLSWPALEYPRMAGEIPSLPPLSSGPFASSLGDMALGFETCQKDAIGRDFNNHIAHLIVHGFLHLLGHDHENDKDAVMMENLEVELLQKMNIDNPYLET